ncbi:MAG: hypothetical protein ABI472_12235 [Ginsengibacter sp.]
MNLSPIALFVYNRPWHTQKTLEALSDNDLAKESTLYIFADGPKENATAHELQKIEETREIIKSKQWCKDVIVSEKEKNIGLADSIISGVTEVVNKHEKIIVLEDDIVTSKGFLKYMNDALNFYEKEEKVMHISGYMFPVKTLLPPTFFYNPTSCWGWATWQKAWKHFNNDAQYLLTAIDNKALQSRFNIENSHDFCDQLKANADGRLKTWAIKWYASVFILQGLSLHPFPSLVNNIGMDSSGENCDTSSAFEWKELGSEVIVKNIKLSESSVARRGMSEFYKNFPGVSNTKPPNKLRSRLNRILSYIYSK